MPLIISGYFFSNIDNSIVIIIISYLSTIALLLTSIYFGKKSCKEKEKGYSGAVVTIVVDILFIIYLFMTLVFHAG